MVAVLILAAVIFGPPLFAAGAWLLHAVFG